MIKVDCDVIRVKEIRLFKLIVLACLMSFVEVVFASGQKTDTITFLSFNDFHGAFAKDNNIPGAAVFVEALNDIVKQNPHPIVVSGGDNFSGSYFARITRGCPIDRLFEETKTVVSAVGNHEFDWGQAFLVDTAARSIRYLAANVVRDKKNETLFPPYKLLDVVMSDGDTLTVGIVAFTSTETGRKTNPEYIRGLQFKAPNDVAEAYVQHLQKKGADMVVALMHVGTEMKEGKPVIKESDANKIPEIAQVDALITAHSHNVVLGTINGKPVVQAGTNGTHIGKLQFGVSKDANGKWDVCFLSGDTICVPLSGIGDKEMAYVVDSIERLYEFTNVLANSTHQMIHNRTVNAKEYTEVGALVTAAYAYGIDNILKQGCLTIGVNHFNGIRAGLPAGDITKLQLGNVLPFGGNLKAYSFAGSTLKRLLNEGRKNPNGMLQTSNLRLYVNAQGEVVRICKLSGEELKDNDSCVVICDDFIAKGGDGYSVDLFKNEISGFRQETTQIFLTFVGEVHNLPTDYAMCPIVMDGSQEHPYEIGTKEDLVWLRQEVENGRSKGIYFRQTADIDLSAESNWLPIGTRMKPFQGIYDGNGYKVSNIKCKQNDVAGLFGAMVGKDALIANLISGALGDNSDIAGKTAAGICAYIKDATIRNCHNYALIHDAGYYGTTLGGVCGDSHNGTLSYCVNYQTVYSNSSSSAVVAGVLATNAFGAKMENCLNYGNIVNTTMQTGGVCAVSNEGTITTCLNMGSVSGGKAEVGAVCGWNNGEITDCHYWNRDKVKGIGGGKKGNAFAETQKKMEELITDLFSR